MQRIRPRLIDLRWFGTNQRVRQNDDCGNTRVRPGIAAVAAGVPILALTLLVIGDRIFSPPPEEPIRDHQARTKPATVEYEPTFDSQGGRVFDYGQFALHVPQSDHPILTAPLEEGGEVQLSLCWQNNVDGAECSGIQNMVLVRVSCCVRREKIEDGLEDLKQRLKSLDGPYESSMEQIWEFRYRGSKRVLRYALKYPDDRGRHTYAFSHSGPRCNVYSTAAPNLKLYYDFDKTNLEHWPKIDSFVRNRLRSYVVED